MYHYIWVQYVNEVTIFAHYFICSVDTVHCMSVRTSIGDHVAPMKNDKITLGTHIQFDRPKLLSSTPKIPGKE